MGDGASYVPRLSDVHPERCFAATHFCIDNDNFWDYFKRRGGLRTFGYAVSRTFPFQGSIVQFSRRRIVQLSPAGQVGLVNMLDPALLPFRAFNGAQMLGFDKSLVATAPDPTDATATLA